MPAAKGPRCPSCGKPVGPAPAFRPFCSERCKLVDLSKWLGEEYRVGAVGEFPDPEELYEADLGEDPS